MLCRSSAQVLRQVRQYQKGQHPPLQLRPRHPKPIQQVHVDIINLLQNGGSSPGHHSNHLKVWGGRATAGSDGSDSDAEDRDPDGVDLE